MSAVTIIIPCFNNAEQLPTTLAGIAKAADLTRQSEVDLHVVLIDDASTDSTWPTIIQQCEISNLRIQGIRLAANVGAYRAIVVGLEHVKNEAVMVMAADGDDPPELIPSMVGRWHDGCPLIQASRNMTGGSALHRASARLFYASMRMMGFRHVPAYGSDFMLADRSVLNRALIKGFRPGHTLIQLYQSADHAIEIPYKKGKRPSSGWSLMKKADLFVHSLFTASRLPWPVLLMLSVVLPLMLWMKRPDHLVFLYTEMEVAVLFLLVISILSVLRYASKLYQSPPAIAEQC